MQDRQPGLDEMDGYRKEMIMSEKRQTFRTDSDIMRGHKT